MVRLYSKRLLQPFIGVVQVVELDWARALSLDGRVWSLRYTRDEDPVLRESPLRDDPRVKCSLVVNIDGDAVNSRVANRFLDPAQARDDGLRLQEAIRDTPVPFPAGDHYEYWLLDDEDGQPLALLHSGADQAAMQGPVPEPQWRAMAAAELPVPDPVPQREGFYPQPVNYRLERLVEARAGRHPRAAWLRRGEDDKADFPPLLLREAWRDEEGGRLCELYLRRLAPRLLMLSELPRAKRAWLERAARDYALELERFYPLYPEVVDQKLMKAARVEARLRHGNRT